MSVNERARTDSAGARRVVYVRIFFGLALTLGFGSVLFIDYISETNWATSCGALCVAALGLHEFFRMQENRAARPLSLLGIICGTALTAAHWARQAAARGGARPEPDPVWALAAAVFLLLALVSLAKQREKGALDGFFITLSGVIYIWLPIGFLFETRNAAWLDARAGVAAVLHALAVAKMGDVGAFFTGRWFGRRKFAPVLSPGKTVEGSAGGLAFSIGASFAACAIFPDLWRIYGAAGAAVFGAAVGAAAQAGDLFESMIKRASNVKNSGELVPEFGGLLDVIDSVLFAGPVAYFLLACFGA